MEKMTETKILTGDFYIEFDDSIIPVTKFIPDEECNAGNAYILKSDDCFYLYKGNYLFDHITEPGIYKKDDGSYQIVRVSTKEDREKYDINSHLRVLNLTTILDTLKNKSSSVVALPENSSMMYVPTVTTVDDILKRGMKLAMIQKNINLDGLKDHFPDKNALFNFKQVLKNPDSKLSIMLFSRGCEAFGLKYTLLIEELDENNVVGNPLTEPIKVSSEDTHPI